MPGERRFLYKYHLLCPSQGIDEKFCTINQLLAKWGQALDLNQKSCYYIRRRAYKHKYPHIRIVDTREDSCRLPLQILASGCQRHLPGGACEQGDVEFGLELANGIRQSRLSHVQLGCRLPEVAGVGDRCKVAKMP